MSNLVCVIEMNNIQRCDVTLFMSCGLQNYNSPGTADAVSDRREGMSDYFIWNVKMLISS